MSKFSLKVAMMQPTFWPWLGYFGLIHDSDVFVFLDDFQFVKQTFGHRNKLLIAGQESLITLPISSDKSHKDSFCETRPALGPKFVKKTIRSISQNYPHSPWLKDVLDKLENLFVQTTLSLADFNIDFITWACEYCGIDSNFKLSSDLQIEGKRSERVLNILKHYEAQKYLSARGAYDYMCEDGVFPVNDIQVLFQNFKPIPYQQSRAPDFVSHLSIIDAILQIGPQETYKNITQAAGDYKTWAVLTEEGS